MDRIVQAVLVPLGVLVSTFIVVFGLSRLLLATSEEVAVGLALLIAMAILGVASFLASRPTGARSQGR